MDSADVQRWIEGWAYGWAAHDVERIRALYVDGAAQRSEPFRELDDRCVALRVEMDPVEMREARHLAEVDQLEATLGRDRAEALGQRGGLGGCGRPVLLPRSLPDARRADEDRERGRAVDTRLRR